MAKTINELLILIKVIKERINVLKSLEIQVSRSETMFYGKDEKKLIEPKYDVKLVDKKIVELEKFLLEAETKIKTSNAITKVEIDIDVDKLLDPIN